jgi:hypothetical protein
MSEYKLNSRQIKKLKKHEHVLRTLLAENFPIQKNKKNEF